MIKDIYIDVTRKTKGIAQGRIFLGEFDEYFEMALDWWKVEDYIQQWQDGLERLKTHQQSCLVASINNPHKRPYVNWWLLYRENEKIYVQNQMMINDIYHELIGWQWFTSATCYNFIPDRYVSDDEDEMVSEWCVGYGNINE